jgi:hypothetical protein
MIALCFALLDEPNDTLWYLFAISRSFKINPAACDIYGTGPT